jgi:ankyrin repeat protein
MNKISGLFSGLAKSFSRPGKKTERIFAALQDGNYEEMAELVSKMNSKSFIQQVRNENGDTLLNVICDQGNYEAALALSTLPFFKEIVDDGSNEDGWTPVLNAARRDTDVGIELF